MFSIVAVSIYIPINNARGFPFLHTLSSIYCLYVFLHDGHSDWCEVISHCDFDLHSFLAQMVKNLPAMQETPVQSLGKEYLLEKEMATHSSILVGKSHGERNLVSYSSWGHKGSDMTEQPTFSFL